MAEPRTRAHDDSDEDPRIRAMVEYLIEGPLPTPPAEAVQRGKSIAATSAVQGRGIIHHAMEVIATLLFDSRMTPALAGFRGAVGEAVLLYASDVGEIQLQIEPPPHNHRERPTAILGYIAAQQPRGSAQLRRTDDTIVAESPIDDHGMFALTAPSGSYCLTITLGQTTVRIPSLDL